MTAVPAVTTCILIVDDRVENRRLLELLLQSGGWTTCSAASGVEAIELASTVAPCLVLLDVRMPGMDGYQVARALKAKDLTRAIPIVMVTALTDGFTRSAVRDAGADDFLTKPIDRAELWCKVRLLLAS